MHRGLRADGRDAGLVAAAGAYLNECEARVAGSDGLEGERGDRPLPRDSGDIGRARGGDGHQAVALVSMDVGDGLSVTREQVSGIDVDELKDGGGELE